MPTNKATIEQFCEDCNEFIKFIAHDKWNEGLAFFEKKKDLHWTYEAYYEAFMCVRSYAFDIRDHDLTLKHIQRGLKVVEERGRREKITDWSVSNLLSTYNFNDFTDDEVHAELAYAEFCLMVPVFYLENKKSFGHFFHAANYIRRGYFAYQFCRRILKERTRWSSQISRDNFESGVEIFFALIEMGFAIVPPPFSTILRFIGYTGDRHVSYDTLVRCYKMEGVVRRPFIAAVLAAYVGTGRIVLDHGDRDPKFFAEILNYIRNEYAHSKYLNAMDAGEAMMNGDMEGVIRIVSKSDLAFQAKMAAFCFPAFKMCALIFQEKWREAEIDSRIYVDQVWSPATGTFLRACLLQKVMEESTDEMEKLCLRAEITQLLKLVQERRRKIVGISYHEEYILHYSKHFEKRPEDMVLPLYEGMCYVRVFALVNLTKEAIYGILKQVDRRWGRNERDSNHREYYDTKAILLYIRGHCFKHVGRVNDALLCLEQLMEYEKKVTYATHIPPQAAYEIGRLYHGNFGRQKTGKQWIKRSLTYSGYTNSILTKYRAKMTLEDMKRGKKLAKSTSNKDSKGDKEKEGTGLEFIATRSVTS